MSLKIHLNNKKYLFPISIQPKDEFSTKELLVLILIGMSLSLITNSLLSTNIFMAKLR